MPPLQAYLAGRIVTSGEFCSIKSVPFHDEIKKFL